MFSQLNSNSSILEKKILWPWGRPLLIHHSSLSPESNDSGEGPSTARPPNPCIQRLWGEPHAENFFPSILGPIPTQPNGGCKREKKAVLVLIAAQFRFFIQCSTSTASQLGGPIMRGPSSSSPRSEETRTLALPHPPLSPSTLLPPAVAIPAASPSPSL